MLNSFAEAVAANVSIQRDDEIAGQCGGLAGQSGEFPIAPVRPK